MYHILIAIDLFKNTVAFTIRVSRVCSFLYGLVFNGSMRVSSFAN